jgi:hypothetical protein
MDASEILAPPEETAQKSLVVCEKDEEASVDTPEPAGTAAADDLATSNDVNMNEE